MSRHKIVDIVDSFVGHGSILSQELLVGLLGLSIAGQQENLVHVGEALEVSVVPLEHFEDLVGELGVEALTTQIYVHNFCFSEILVVEIIESPVFLLRHISQSMEALDITSYREEG